MMITLYDLARDTDFEFSIEKMNLTLAKQEFFIIHLLY